MDVISTSLDRSSLDLTAALNAYLSSHIGTHVEVGGLTRLSSGWESDVYAFDTSHALGLAREMDRDRDKGRDEADAGHVLRLFFGADAAEKARHEARAYALLGRAGYPVPRVELVEPAPDALGRSFLIMQRIQGVSLGQRWRDADAASLPREIARFRELFVALHTLAWQHLPGAEHVPAFTIDQQVGHWANLIEPLGLNGLEVAISWLRNASANVVAQPLGLVHWDFHHENILIDADDRAWVIDWTQFQATDVRFDLAWTLVVLASERDAASAQWVREGYLAARGWPEETIAEELAYFEAAACCKRLASVVVSLKHGAEALGMRPGAEAIMTSRMARIATVYDWWLALTATEIPVVAEMLAEYL